MSDQSQSAQPVHRRYLAGHDRANHHSQTPDAVVGHFRNSPPTAADIPAGDDIPSSAADPILTRLSEALVVAERTTHHDTELFADALRLAIRTRLIDLKSAPQGGSSQTAEPKQLRAERRALQKWRLRRVVDYVDQHLSSKITLADLATVAGLSRMHFAAQFRVATGVRPHEYLLRRRVQLAEQLLRQSSLPIVEIALSVGFQTQAHFTTVFKRFAGDTPYQWRHSRCVGMPAARDGQSACIR